jgi:hypothetical protein
MLVLDVRAFQGRRVRAMTITDTSFRSLEAPCGRMVGGQRHQDRDDECLLTDDVQYDCGCRRTRHEYHDGSLTRVVVHHDGTVLVDELLAGE